METDIINEVTNGFFKKYNSNLDSVDFKNSKHEVLVELTDVEPVNPNAIMTILPGGTHNVMIWSLGLPPDFEECCKILSTFDNIQRIDVTAAIVMASNDEDSKSKFRILLNAAEMGFGGRNYRQV